MMVQIAVGFLLVLLLRELVLTTGMYRTLTEESRETCDDPIKITTIVPVVREQDVIGELIGDFSQSASPERRFKLAIVADDEEPNELDTKLSKMADLIDDGYGWKSVRSEVPEPFPRSSYEDVVTMARQAENTYEYLRKRYEATPNTLQVAREKIAELGVSDTVYTIRSENDPGRANAINYVVDNLDQVWDDPSGDHFIGLYDADSSIPADVLTQVAASREYPVIQNNSVYLKNFESISLLNQLFALTHSRFSLGYEASKNRLVSGLRKHNAPLKVFHHLVGHGLFIDRELLVTVGGFTGPYDDVRMGNLISALDIPVGTVGPIESVETPERPVLLVRQLSEWFKGSTNLLSIPTLYRDVTGEQLPYRYYPGLVMKFCTDYVAWLVTGPLLIASLAVTLTISWSVFAVIYALFVASRGVSILMLRSVAEFSVQRALLTALIWPAHAVLKTVGGAYRFYHELNDRESKIKTER